MHPKLLLPSLNKLRKALSSSVCTLLTKTLWLFWLVWMKLCCWWSFTDDPSWLLKPRPGFKPWIGCGTPALLTELNCTPDDLVQLKIIPHSLFFYLCHFWNTLSFPTKQEWESTWVSEWAFNGNERQDVPSSLLSLSCEVSKMYSQEQTLSHSHNTSMPSSWLWQQRA